MSPKLRLALIAAAAAALAGCATPYTGPVEVTRFVTEDRARLATGEIVVEVDSPADAELSTRLYADAVAAELARIGYSVNRIAEAPLVATIRLERVTAGQYGRHDSPVSVGVGGQTGSFGSGVGLGVGINLGGNRHRERDVTRLFVRLSERAGGTAVWEGRAEIATSADSPYARASTNARVLAAALFRDFPGGNGETVTIDVNQLQGTQ